MIATGVVHRPTPLPSSGCAGGSGDGTGGGGGGGLGGRGSSAREGMKETTERAPEVKELTVPAYVKL